MCPKMCREFDDGEPFVADEQPTAIRQPLCYHLAISLYTFGRTVSPTAIRGDEG